MIEQIEAMEKSTEQIVSFLEGLEAAARSKLAEQTDDFAAQRIIDNAGLYDDTI